MMTPEIAKSILTEAHKAGGDRLQAAVNTILLDLVERQCKLEQFAVQLYRRMGGTVQGKPAPAAAPAAPAQAHSTMSPGGVRMSASGAPLSDEEAALEDQMDAAIEASGGESPEAEVAAEPAPVEAPAAPPAPAAPVPPVAKPKTKPAPAAKPQA